MTFINIKILQFLQGCKTMQKKIDFLSFLGIGMNLFKNQKDTKDIFHEFRVGSLNK